MAGLTVLSLMVWTGMLPVPDPGFAQPQATSTAPVEPCPPADAVTAQISSIPVNVYNGTDTPGLAKDVSQTLQTAGLTVSNVTDWPRGNYSGDVLLTSSPAGLANAYSIAQIFNGTVLVDIDENTAADDTSVSIVLGTQYSSGIFGADEISQVQAGQPITAPKGCKPVTAASAAPTEG